MNHLLLLSTLLTPTTFANPTITTIAIYMDKDNTLYIGDSESHRVMMIRPE